MVLPVNSIINRLQFYWQLLKDNPLNFFIYLLIYVLAILISLILHEMAHGYVAFRCGDPTAKMLGRLSINPLHHLDPFGTVCMVLLGFGWAKPVPVNPRNFRNYRWDDLKVSLAGIVTNLILFLLSTSLCVGFMRLVWKPEVLEYYTAYTLLSPSEGYRNSLVVYGTQIGDNVFRSAFVAQIQRFFLMLAQINLSLAIFNILPIPPLDGFHVLNDTILGGKLSLNPRIFQICQIVLMLVCFTGLLGNLLGTATTAINNGVIRLMVNIARLP